MAQFQQGPCIAGEDLLALGRRYVKRFDRIDRLANKIAAAVGVERSVGGEQTGFGAEEFVAAAGRRADAERGVGIEHLEIVEWRPFEAALLGERITVGRAVKYL